MSAFPHKIQMIVNTGKSLLNQLYTIKSEQDHNVGEIA